MSYQFSLGKKISLGFAVILCLTFGVGITAYFALSEVMEGVTFHRKIYEAQEAFSKAKIHIEQYQYNSYEEGREQQAVAKWKAFHHLGESVDALAMLEHNLIQLPELDLTLDQAKLEIQSYHEAFNRYVTFERDKVEMERDLHLVGVVLTELIDSGEFLIGPMQTASQILLNEISVYSTRHTVARWERVTASLSNMEQATKLWLVNVDNSDTLRPIGQKIRDQFSLFREHVEQYHRDVLEQQNAQIQMAQHQENFDQLLQWLYVSTLEEMQAIELTAFINIFGGMGGALFVGLLFSGISTRRWIILPILDLTTGAKKLAQGEWDQPLPVERNDELGSLAESFGHMRDEIRKKIDELFESNQALSQANSRWKLLLESTEQITSSVDKFNAMIVTVNALLITLRFLFEVRVDIFFKERLANDDEGYAHFQFPVHTNYPAALRLDSLKHMDHTFVPQLPNMAGHQLEDFETPRLIQTNMLFIPIRLRDRILGAIVISGVDMTDVNKEDEKFIGILSYALSVTMENIRYQRHLERQVIERTYRLNESLHQLEQQNTTLLASNRKLEDLDSTKEQLLNKLGTLQESHLDAIEQNLAKLRVSNVEELQAPILQIERQLHQIEEIVQPITSLYQSEQAIQSQRVLLAETNKKQQIIAKMALGGTGVELDIASNMEEGQHYLEQHGYDIICTNTELLELARLANEKYPDIQSVLMTFKGASFYHSILQSYPFLSNIVSRSEEDRTFTLKNITTTISKLVTQNFFGLEKYLNWGVDVQEYPVVDSETRIDLVDTMEDYFRQMGVRRLVLNKSTMVAEELLMNAIYDAPSDPNGKPRYNHLPRTTQVFLKPEEQGVFRYACDGSLLAVSVEDPFGAFRRETILKYLESCYAGQGGTLQKNKGGAGRGLFQIMETADLVVFNIKPHLRTEVIVLFNIAPDKPKRNNTSSFHYFYAAR